jgi:hypothetical protein
MFARTMFLGLLVASAAAAGTAPVEVMILGTFHMANPGRDLHNQKVPDVLAPQEQAQLARIATSLAAFKPTRVDVEWPKETVAERYPQFLAGTLPPSRNEVVQLGFRLGRITRAAIEGIDADGDFPYEPVEAWAKAHGRGRELEAMGAAVEKRVQEESEALRDHGIAGELRLINDPARLARGQEFYGSMPRFGSGDEQPGVALLTAWYKRNMVICARIAQQATPGDRIVVMFGSGHAFLLRRCVGEIPGWKLVEPAAFLPK